MTIAVEMSLIIQVVLNDGHPESSPPEAPEGGGAAEGPRTRASAASGKILAGGKVELISSRKTQGNKSPRPKMGENLTAAGAAAPSRQALGQRGHCLAVAHSEELLPQPPAWTEAPAASTGDPTFRKPPSRALRDSALPLTVAPGRQPPGAGCLSSLVLDSGQAFSRSRQV